MEICFRQYPHFRLQPASGFNLFIVGLQSFMHIATSEWAVETFCMSKQMSLWTKCFHLLVQVAHSFVVVFCHPLRFWASFHNLLLFAWKSFSVQLLFSYACHIIQLDIECTVCCFFLHLLTESHVRQINVLVNVSLKSNRT